MSVLIKMNLTSVVVLSAIICLAACSRGSTEYRHIKDLPYSEWNTYASTLPIGERLDLHKEIMERTWHTPKALIVESFDNAPKRTYDELIRRIRNGDTNRFYLPVLYEINQSSDFKICQQPDRKVIQGYLAGTATGAVNPNYRPDFYTC